MVTGDYPATAGDQAKPGLEILLVEDEPEIAEPIADALRDEGHHLTVVSDGQRAMNRLDAQVFDVLICDVRLPGVDGLSIFRRIREEQPHTAVILMSAYGSVAEAVAAVKDNAAHYLAKPFSLDELIETVARIAEERAFEEDLQRARTQIAGMAPGVNIIGETPAMVALKERIEAIADTDAPVLITGETGTGKDLVARTLHGVSPRSAKPFVDVNCAAFPDTLLEAELFGHEKGAFTGAQRKREGRFRAADGGTLFLDEVGEMSPGAQAKLLRALQEKAFQPLGTNTTVRVDVRTVSATNVDLRTRIDGSAFREDLYYRLKVFHLHVPPLRERRADLPLLVEYFCRELGEANAEEPPKITPRAWAALSHYRFSGNVRELRHAMHHALVLARGRDIDLEHLPEEMRGDSERSSTRKRALQPLEEAHRQFEREYLLRVLAETDWNKTRASEILGISRKTLWQKLKRHDID